MTELVGKGLDLRLLVVEDDAALREEITRVLERRTGYEFDTAENAEVAIELFNQMPYDLVITDVRMPGMNGIDMLEVLKEQKPDLVSVIITAFADESATIKALKIGANDYIRKPFSIRDLLAAIQRQVTIIELKKESARQQRFLGGMVRNLVSGVLALDKDGRIVAANDKAHEALKLDDNALQKVSTWQDLQMSGNEEVKLLDTILDELEHSGADLLERNLKVIQSGLEIPYRISAFALRDQDNQRLGTVFLFNDISTVVQQEKLSAWKDLARTVAHEIKNPLTPIILGAQQLRTARGMNTEILLQQFDRAIDNIITNADRLNNLAREFSRFGRLPDNKIVPVHLLPLVQNSIDTFKHRIDQQNIKTDLVRETETDLIRGDADSLQRMFENLIGNACDAMPEGGRLCIKVAEAEPGWLAVAIEDDGEGIDDEILNSLFKPYVTSKEGGTGLGLVVVKEVIDRHDGKIAVESEKGRCTRFTIQLPRLKA